MQNANEPMEKIHVQKTTNYDLFKPIGGNRSINELHIKRLIKSMETMYLFTLIIVNENYEVIDGQHRLEACRKLNLPVYYLMISGYGLKEVQHLNQNSKTWTSDDYMNGYCELGYDHYIEYAKFKERFQFGHKECMILLGGNDNADYIKEFWGGEFHIKNYKQAYDKALKIEMVGKYYNGNKRSGFVRVMNALLNNPIFDFNQFMQKLKMQPLSLQDCANAEQYKLVIEEIYNYRRREKVNLRY